MSAIARNDIKRHRWSTEKDARAQNFGEQQKDVIVTVVVVGSGVTNKKIK
jgi:hypothetical protein